MTQAPTAPEGRKLLRLEVRNAETPIERKPEWIKTRAKMGPEYTALQSLVKSEGLHTVCQEAGCPNIFECWEDREATFLIGGDQCTRRCDFCQIDTGKPQPLDRDEPRRVAESVQKMELRYATITGVARDDLEDGGAWLYAETVRAIHELNPGTGVENLIPDFNGKPDLLQRGLRVAVPRCSPTTSRRCRGSSSGSARRSATTARSTCITQARDFGLVTKSNLILGMGETREEVCQALRDLHDAGCELITITQYLRPSLRHHPVERWVKPEEFVELKDEADEIGFSGVLSGPLVRSSYRAGRLYRQAMDAASIRRLTADRPPQLHAAAHRMTQGTPHVDPDPQDEPAQAVHRRPTGWPRSPTRGIGLWIARRLPARRRRRLRAVLVPARRRHARPGHLDRRRAAVRLPRRDDRLRPPRAEGGVRPDGGPARRRPRRACRCCAAAGRSTRSSASPSSRTSCTASSARPASSWSARATPPGVQQLLANERRKHERVASDAPIHEVVCGSGEGEVPLPQAGAPRPEARQQGQARRDDRPAPPAQGARRATARTSRCPRARCRPA